MRPRILLEALKKGVVSKRQLWAEQRSHGLLIKIHFISALQLSQTSQQENLTRLKKTPKNLTQPFCFGLVTQRAVKQILKRLFRCLTWLLFVFWSCAIRIAPKTEQLLGNVPPLSDHARQVPSAPAVSPVPGILGAQGAAELRGASGPLSPPWCLIRALKCP